MSASSLLDSTEYTETSFGVGTFNVYREYLVTFNSLSLQIGRKYLREIQNTTVVFICEKLFH